MRIILLLSGLLFLALAMIAWPSPLLAQAYDTISGVEVFKAPCQGNARCLKCNERDGIRPACRRGWFRQSNGVFYACAPPNLAAGCINPPTPDNDPNQDSGD